uniref:L-fucose mutarotase n=1 Tax=Gasterosteus aculeatus aculeatus TaxID=481459 RepID=A0AAQ4QXY4_GASAC
MWFTMGSNTQQFHNDINHHAVSGSAHRGARIGTRAVVTQHPEAQKSYACSDVVRRCDLLFNSPGSVVDIMVVLKGIPAVLSPELLFALAQMGHGDELVLADANFPASSICACGPKEIRADGLGIPQLLEAILKLLPLDTYVPSPVQDHESLNDVSRREIRTGFLSLWATCCLFNLSVSLLLKAAVMDLVESDKQRCLAVPVWDTYTRLLGQAGCQSPLERVERFSFYERAKKAYVVVATGETALYGNVMLKKGVLSAELLQ